MRIAANGDGQIGVSDYWEGPSSMKTAVTTDQSVKTLEEILIRANNCHGDHEKEATSVTQPKVTTSGTAVATIDYCISSIDKVVGPPPQKSSVA